MHLPPAVPMAIPGNPRVSELPSGFLPLSASTLRFRISGRLFRALPSISRGIPMAVAGNPRILEFILPRARRPGQLSYLGLILVDNRESRSVLVKGVRRNSRYCCLFHIFVPRKSNFSLGLQLGISNYIFQYKRIETVLHSIKSRILGVNRLKR